MYINGKALEVNEFVDVMYYYDFSVKIWYIEPPHNSYVKILISFTGSTWICINIILE